MADIHLIGNAHLDPVWLWRWQEGFSEILATFKSALDRMNDFPDYKFTSACAVYYQWIEKLDPDMFEEIKKRVKEGRWNIVGGWFLQPDCNMPGGESFARHALISQRYFKDKFGVSAKTGYNVDSFGHNASLPKILKQSGMDNYVFMRPMPFENPNLKHLFMWESDDGSQVCAYRIPEFYCVHSERLDTIKNIKADADRDNQPYMAFYGVGNHGGGPTIKLIKDINALNIEGTKYSTPDEYFDVINKASLPVVHDELQHHARGCYSACTYVKAFNRKVEANIITAEKLCMMANKLTGLKYPAKKLEKAWKNLMFNQFHDILGGCSIKSAYDDASYLFGEAMSISEQAICASMQKICRNIDTLQGETLPSAKEDRNFRIWQHELLGTPIIVFNPHTWHVKADVQVSMRTSKMTDNNGIEIPFQLVRAEQTNGSTDKYGTAFTAEIEPFGYRVYRLFGEEENASKDEFKNTLKITQRSLENSKIKIEFDVKTGDICSFYDKTTDEYIINRPCSAVLLDETDCDTWAHDKTSLGDTVAEFDSPEFTITEEGPVRATLKVKTSCASSQLIRYYSITPDNDVVSVKTVIDFHEKHRVLKFSFPVNDDKVIAKIPYGTITRPYGTGEEPCGEWFASGKLCVANDSKYAYDTTADSVRMTVLRSAIYADHYGERDDFCEYMEQGIHKFTYTLFPFRSKVYAERNAAVLNSPLLTSVDSFHKGNLPEEKSFFEANNDSIVVSAIKHSEDDECAVIRFFEAEGENTTVTLKLFEDEISCSVKHNELKTFKSTGDEVNLIEW